MTPAVLGCTLALSLSVRRDATPSVYSPTGAFLTHPKEMKLIENGNEEIRPSYMECGKYIYH